MSEVRALRPAETDIEEPVALPRDNLFPASEQVDGLTRRLLAQTTALSALLARLEALIVPEHLPAVSALAARLKSDATQVTMLGQVKAGKTMLTNALIGMPGMLPSDVNPWTSVVTSIHINSVKPSNSNVVFTFYTESDWANLTHGGGRLGELAERANFEGELVEMRAQIEKMQRRAEKRLGSNFAFLLGERHSFSGFNTGLIERYVCLGDEDEGTGQGGRYADVTKAADLYIDDSSYGFPVTISDTPGVNDPFLARERATLDTLSRSDVCVVVLSAHQALSTVDVGLLRILRTLKAEQVILFVNRIDELPDPDRQIREIDGFIRSVLREQGMPDTLPVVYGSAVWAEQMLLGPAATSAGMGEASLQKLVSARLARPQPAGPQTPGMPPYSINKTDDLSGLFELKTLISRLAVAHVAAPRVASVLAEAADLARQSTLLIEHALDADVAIRPGLDIDRVFDHLDRSLERLDDDCRTAAVAISDRMLMAMSTAFRAFIDAETKALREVLTSGRKINDWQPDSEGLRKELNAAYHTFAEQSRSVVASIFTSAAEMVTSVYAAVLPKEGLLFTVRAPQVIALKPPATLMRTMTVDMKPTWVQTWLARAIGPDVFVSRFADAVTGEMKDFLRDMSEMHVAEFVNSARRQLHDFLLDHLQTLKGLAVLDGRGYGDALRQKLGVELAIRQRLGSIRGLVTELEALADGICADFGIDAK